jgi:hypothetical protein
VLFAGGCYVGGRYISTTAMLDRLAGQFFRGSRAPAVDPGSGPMVIDGGRATARWSLQGPSSPMTPPFMIAGGVLAGSSVSVAAAEVERAAAG